MVFVLGTLASLVAYAGGLVIVTKVTPQLFRRSYDEGLFMAIAAADIIGAILAFGAVAITFGLFNGAFGARLLDFLLLVGILIITLRMAFRSFRRRRFPGSFLSSCVAASVYNFLLAAAAVFGIVLLFVP